MESRVFPELSGTVSVVQDRSFKVRTLTIEVCGDSRPVLEFFEKCGHTEPFEFVHPVTREKVRAKFQQFAWDESAGPMARRMAGEPLDKFQLVVVSPA